MSVCHRVSLQHSVFKSPNSRTERALLIWAWPFWPSRNSLCPCPQQSVKTRAILLRPDGSQHLAEKSESPVTQSLSANEFLLACNPSKLNAPPREFRPDARASAVATAPSNSTILRPRGSSRLSSPGTRNHAFTGSEIRRAADQSATRSSRSAGLRPAAAPSVGVGLELFQRQPERSRCGSQTRAPLANQRPAQRRISVHFPS